MMTDLSFDPTTLAEEDSAARDAALDVTRSFLIQAPAGSGKTALLMQRFLALLARVDRPEAIVAMTFTRKAAAEMRERISAALGAAASGIRGANPHEQRTCELAGAALAQDARLGWQLAAHPARLQIHTIDALCASLVRQAPLASRVGAAPRFEERAAQLYRRAADAALRSAATDDQGWKTLLGHMDNDAQRTIELLADMLAKREQWLRELPPAADESLRRRLEAALAAETSGELAAIHAAFPRELAAELAVHQRYAAGLLARKAESAELASSLDACCRAGGLPQPTAEALPQWRDLARWLLRADCPVFRQRVDLSKGFPAKGNDEGAEERGEAKGAMHDLLSRLALVPGLARALDAARRLPPARYDDDAWALIAALAGILRRCTAELLIGFADDGAIDYPQGTLGALAALGETDAPSDLLLRLDRRHEHLLIDEFQDTSFSQLELIRRLTAGWQEGDGRTIFAVGDPMQSIYRFRQAEVRLFVQAQHDRRIAEVPVERLALRRNFRSQSRLVDWTNSTFPLVLGATDDPWRGVVAFAPATATHPPGSQPAATLELVGDAQAEASATVARIGAALASGAKDVGVLVRARTHLEQILPALRAAAIPYAAIELDALSERTTVLDLVSLTHALMQPADRLAWLSVLRAPWCGLALPDLFALAALADAERLASLADLLSTAKAAEVLSAQGRARFAQVATVLTSSLAARGRATLSARVHGAWLALGGPACVEEALDLVVARQFFALLAEHERAGEIHDWSAFLDALAELRAEPAPATGPIPAAPVKVMTLHKAKGLEFDTVILPGLARTTPRGGPELLRWRRRPSGVLVGALRARGGSDDSPVYDYLSLLAREEEDAELGRLLYVGCTRAEQRLHLIAALETELQDAGAPRWKSPPAGSALAKLWPALPVPLPASPIAQAEAKTNPRRLWRLPPGWRAPEAPASVPLPPQRARTEPETAPVFDWARETARSVGTVAHRVLRQIAQEGIERWSEARIAASRARLAAELAHERVAASEVSAAVERIQTALRRTLDDPRARWLFAPDHQDARSEYAVTAINEGALRSVVLDRTFVDEAGTRWIVDFKFSQHEGAGVDRFLDNERERYRSQLEEYAEVMRVLDSRPIRLGLYFPLLAGWREWPAPA